MSEVPLYGKHVSSRLPTWREAVVVVNLINAFPPPGCAMPECRKWLVECKKWLVHFLQVVGPLLNTTNHFLKHDQPLLVVFPAPLEAHLAFENCCLAEQIDVWQAQQTPAWHIDMIDRTIDR